MLHLQIGWAKNGVQWYIPVLFFVREMKSSPVVAVNWLDELAQHEVG